MGHLERNLLIVNWEARALVVKILREDATALNKAIVESKWHTGSPSHSCERFPTRSNGSIFFFFYFCIFFFFCFCVCVCVWVQHVGCLLECSIVPLLDCSLVYFNQVPINDKNKIEKRAPRTSAEEPGSAPDSPTVSVDNSGSTLHICIIRLTPLKTTHP